MSRTDKDRPYRVRVQDPFEKNRYWSTSYGSPDSRWYRSGHWALDIFPTNRPQRWVRRDSWSKVRSKEQDWRTKVKFDHELEAPDGRARHSMLWWWL